jgi:hypothetical protein
MAVYLGGAEDGLGYSAVSIGKKPRGYEGGMFISVGMVVKRGQFETGRKRAYG